MAPSTNTISDGTVEVFTFKRGVLSRLAHDLCLRLRRFEVEAGAGRVRARFSPDSLEVVGVVKDGHADPSVLSATQCAEIQQNIRVEILRSDRYPTIEFSGSYDAVDGKPSAKTRVRGELELVGRKVTIEFPVTAAHGKLEGEVTLTPTRWGIPPFQALMGAIKLEDRVIVRFALPLPEGP